MTSPMQQAIDEAIAWNTEARALNELERLLGVRHIESHRDIMRRQFVFGIVLHTKEQLLVGIDYDDMEHAADNGTLHDLVITRITRELAPYLLRAAQINYEKAKAEFNKAAKHLRVMNDLIEKSKPEDIIRVIRYH